MTKRQVILAVGVPWGLLLVATSAVWLTGSTTDPVLGRAALSATGTQIAPGTVGLALVVGAALVAVLTGGPKIRTVAGGLMTLAALAAAVSVARAIGAPEELLSRRAGELAGRTGSSVPVTGQREPWIWAAGTAAAAMTAASAWATHAARRWAGLSARFERDTAPGGPGRATRRSAWDDLSEGHDPTRADTDEAT